MSTKLKVKRDLRKDEKLAPQAKVIFDAVSKAGAAGVDRVALVEKLKFEGSKQTPGKVLSFYQSRLVKDGLIELIKEKKEKPAAKQKKAS